MSDPQFSPDDVRRALDELVDELVARGASTHIRVVGGAGVMIQAGREALTRDIDALYPPSHHIDEAIRAVARSNNWPVAWLNDAVKMYASDVDNDDDWEIRIARAGVVVSVARCPLLLAMKLLAGRARDIDDIARLLVARGITTRDGAMAVFDRYYPSESMKPRTSRILDDVLAHD